MMSSILATAFYLLALASWEADAAPIRPDVSGALQAILKNTHGSKAYTYPTDLTRDIFPKPMHSHNDYWRDVPFYSALSYGAISVEADVWLINGSLFIGHEQAALTKERTFDALYVKPILDTLKRENAVTPFTTSTTHNGVYDTSSDQTLYLYVDVKTDGPTTWAAVLSALAPLCSANWCTTTNGNSVTKGAVTVIGTGNTPLSYFLPVDPASPSNPRFTFYDAQISTLGDPSNSNITSLISLTAATDFNAQFGTIAYSGFNGTQLAKLRTQIGVAKGKAIKPRYWNTPAWPIRTRNLVWKTLADEGVGLLNVDDLEAGAKFWAGTGGE